MKNLSPFVFALLILISGCSSDDNPSTPSTGEVLLAEIAGDSVGTSSGLSTKTASITTGMLNFTDRDSAKISFYCSNQNNAYIPPLVIAFVQDTVSIPIYSATNIPVTIAEQYVEVTIPSPRVNAFFRYTITTLSSGSSSYFKFSQLKISKK